MRIFFVVLFALIYSCAITLFIGNELNEDLPSGAVANIFDALINYIVTFAISMIVVSLILYYTTWIGIYIAGGFLVFKVFVKTLEYFYG